MANAARGTAYRHLRDLFSAGSVRGLEDRQVLARSSRTNDPVAFKAVVTRRGPLALATCRAVAGNEHDVEDAFFVLKKKAGSILGAETLGDWMHRVAYHASVRANLEGRKRGRKEEQAAVVWGHFSRTETDLASLLHEEIERLPEGERLPVVLCDLEGPTYEQAARQLGWTVPALRCRLARARQRLKGRLFRLGVSSLGVGPLVLPRQASAGVPPGLLRATLLAATGGAASAGAALLTRTLLRGMLMPKLKAEETSEAGEGEISRVSAPDGTGRLVDEGHTRVGTRSAPSAPIPKVTRDSGMARSPTETRLTQTAGHASPGTSPGLIDSLAAWEGRTISEDAIVELVARKGEANELRDIKAQTPGSRRTDR